MNYRTLALIGVRLLAIWLIVVGIADLPPIADLWRFPVSGTNAAAIHWFLTWQVLMLIAPLILGLILWLISRRLSRFVAPAIEGALPAAATPMLIQGAIAIAGLVIVVTELPNLIYTVVTVVNKAGVSHHYTVPSSYTAEISLSLWTTLAVRVILVLLGVGMVVGSRRLRAWIYGLRTINTGGSTG